MLHAKPTNLESTRMYKGFTLVEVLIAVIVLGIGLLGIAGLQLTGIKNNYTAYTRSQAVDLVSSLADKMRANIGATVDGTYIATSAANPGFDCSATFPGAATSCTESEISQVDLFSWFQLASTSLPLNTASPFSITCTTTAGVEIVANAAGDTCPKDFKHTITLNWYEQDPDAGLATKSMSIDFQP